MHCIIVLTNGFSVFFFLVFVNHTVELRPMTSGVFRRTSLLVFDRKTNGFYVLFISYVKRGQYKRNDDARIFTVRRGGKQTKLACENHRPRTDSQFIFFIRDRKQIVFLPRCGPTTAAGSCDVRRSPLRRCRVK